MCEDVSRSVGEHAPHEMANPLYFIRRFPWASAAVAVAIGYLLVPEERSRSLSPIPEMLAELVRKQQVKVETTKAGTDSQGMLKSLVVMGLTWALRTGLTYAGQQLAAAAMQKPPQAGTRKRRRTPAGAIATRRTLEHDTVMLCEAAPSIDSKRYCRALPIIQRTPARTELVENPRQERGSTDSNNLLSDHPRLTLAAAAAAGLLSVGW